MRVVSIIGTYLAVYIGLSVVGVLFNHLLISRDTLSLNVAVTVISTLITAKLFKVRFGTNRATICLCIAGALAAVAQLVVYSFYDQVLSNLGGLEALAAGCFNGVAVVVTLLLVRGKQKVEG